MFICFPYITYFDICRLCAMSREDSDVKGCLGTPLPVLPTLLHPLDVTKLRNERENDLQTDH